LGFHFIAAAAEQYYFAPRVYFGASRISACLQAAIYGPVTAADGNKFIGNITGSVRARNMGKMFPFARLMRREGCLPLVFIAFDTRNSHAFDAQPVCVCLKNPAVHLQINHLLKQAVFAPLQARFAELTVKKARVYSVRCQFQW
jgi:hypothetical protein